MLGFEITINGEDIIRKVSSNGILIVSFDPQKDLVNMTILGLDANYYFLHWPNMLLKAGDRVKVRITEIDANTPLKYTKISDRNELIKRYLEIEKELKTEGFL